MPFFSSQRGCRRNKTLPMLVMFSNSKKMLPSSCKELIIVYTEIINGPEEDKNKAIPFLLSLCHLCVPLLNSLVFVYLIYKIFACDIHFLFDV